MIDDLTMAKQFDKQFELDALDVLKKPLTFWKIIVSRLHRSYYEGRELKENMRPAFEIFKILGVSRSEYHAWLNYLLDTPF